MVRAIIVFSMLGVGTQRTSQMNVPVKANRITAIANPARIRFRADFRFPVWHVGSFLFIQHIPYTRIASLEGPSFYLSPHCHPDQHVIHRNRNGIYRNRCHFLIYFRYVNKKVQEKDLQQIIGAMTGSKA
jgi:hypothetical protein